MVMIEVGFFFLCNSFFIPEQFTVYVSMWECLWMKVFGYKIKNSWKRLFLFSSQPATSRISNGTRSGRTFIIMVVYFENVTFIHAKLYRVWKFATGRGDGLAVESRPRNPGNRGSIPRLGSRRSSLISIEHAELLRSTRSLLFFYTIFVPSHMYPGTPKGPK